MGHESIYARTNIYVPLGIIFAHELGDQKILVEVVTRSHTRVFAKITKNRKSVGDFSTRLQEILPGRDVAWNKSNAGKSAYPQSTSQVINSLSKDFPEETSSFHDSILVR